MELFSEANPVAFMELSLEANPVDDSPPFAKPIKVLAAAQSEDGNFVGVPLPVAEPLLPPRASTFIGVSSEAHPVEDLSPVSESIKVHAVETTPPIVSLAELVDEPYIFENMFDSFQADGDINELDHPVLEEFENDGLVSPSLC